jgi:hypothetical protein
MTGTIVREARRSDLDALLKLYLELAEDRSGAVTSGLSASFYGSGVTGVVVGGAAAGLMSPRTTAVATSVSASRTNVSINDCSRPRTPPTATARGLLQVVLGGVLWGTGGVAVQLIRTAS